MTQNRFQEAKRIYNSALEREPEQRQAYLDEACAGDVSLRKEVESLLACQPDAKEFFKSPAMQAGAQALAGGKVGTGSPVPDFGDRGACPTFPDLTGRTLLHYTLTDKIGEGGMGVVYKARDLHLDRSVAIKILPAYAMADPERKRRFVQEAKAASALNHPHVVQIFDISSDAGVDFIAMEYVPGKTLDQRIGRKGLLVKEVLKYGVQVADALAAAHAAGIIHRDLKPANIVVTDKGQVKVLDFGLAKLTQPTSGDLSGGLSEAQTLTEEGRILGTVAYMSPEQAEGKAVDARSDIFSLGTVLYEMATGRHPFRKDSSASTMAAILREDPKPLREWSGITPAELERVIHRCLRKDPDRRFQSMADLKVALEELKEESDSGALTRAVSTIRRRRRLAWAAVALMLAAAVGLGAWFALFRRPAPRPMMKESAVTSLGTAPWNPALSPDGKQLAFVWGGAKEGNSDIYVQLVGETAPRRLTTDPAFEYSPVWSPDALHIAFLRETADATDIIIIPAAGGVEQRVHTSRAACRFSIKSLCRQFCGIAWSPDGKYLAMVDKESPQLPNSLYLLDIKSRERRKLTTPPAGWFGDGLSVFSPDGRTLAFIRTPGGFPSDLYVLPITGSGEAAAEPRRITHDANFIFGIEWTADGRGIVFASMRGGVSALWSVAASGGEPERLPVGGNGAMWPTISRTGNRLAYSTPGGDRNIWRAALPGGAAPDDAGAPTRLIYSREEDFQPSFSPDGKKIAFSSNRSGNFEVYICGADGSSPTRLTYFNDGGGGHPVWSPDGRQIAFKGGRKMSEQNRIHVVSADGGTPRRLTKDDFDETRASWSRDGKWIYISSDRGTGSQVWKVPAEGGVPLQLTREGGFRPFVSVDGNSVYFLRGNSTRPSIWRMAPDGGEETPVVELGARAMWTVSESGIYMLDPDAKGGPAIELFRFDTRTRIPVLKLLGEPDDYHWGVGSFTVSPDERWILYEHKDHREAEIMLVENFR